MQCGTIKVLYCVTIYIYIFSSLVFSVLRPKQCVCGRNIKRMHFVMLTLPYWVIFHIILIGVKCNFVSNIVFMKGIDRQCGVSRLQ